MTEFNRAQTITRVRKLFSAFKHQYGIDLNEEKVLEVIGSKFQRDCKEHIERTIGDVGLKTLMTTIDVLKKREYLVKDTPPPIKNRKKATKKKAAKKKAESRVQP